MRVRTPRPVSRLNPLTSRRTPAPAKAVPPPGGAPPPSATCPDAPRARTSFVVDNAVYYGGRRIASPPSLADTYALLDRHVGMAWIGLLRPTEAQFATVAQEFGLHELAAEDAVQAHQRPKLERYGDTLFVVLRPARTTTSWRRSCSARCMPSWDRTSW